MAALPSLCLRGFTTFLRSFRPSPSPSPTTFTNIRVHPSLPLSTTTRNPSTLMSLPSSDPVAAKTDTPTAGSNGDVLVQYVVLRRDLIDTWPLGSVVTQGCHASVSAIWSHKDDPHTLQYCSPQNIDSMHKFCFWGHDLSYPETKSNPLVLAPYPDVPTQLLNTQIHQGILPKHTLCIQVRSQESTLPIWCTSEKQKPAAKKTQDSL
ncbi:hypothetical protein V6N11_057770 [Hibiscus sabdariffa]|uniref:peptidyl-tRNA hydrolase n=1 Tax=Hibiscus sabdariffa TaxID=183260 RepID=A0ABR2NIC4_9ROSI